MSEGDFNAREIDLGDDCGAVVVKANGATVKIDADSHVIVSTGGGVELQPGTALEPAHDSAAETKEVPDVWVALAKAYRELPDYNAKIDSSGFLRDVWNAFKDDTKRIWRERNKPTSPPPDRSAKSKIAPDNHKPTGGSGP